VKNHLIERLPCPDRLRLLAVGEQIQLHADDALWQRGQTIQHVYFPTDGFISLFAEIDRHPGLEVGMIGAEGMLGAQILLDVPTAPLRAQVQGPGSAWRIAAPDFRAELARSRALQRAIQSYIHVRMTQLATSTACTRFHLLAPRLARWLLMSQDRSHSSHFHVTHEFLAFVLGVRRVGITVAASRFQRSGLIAYHRGDVTVLDRDGLEAAACSCYHTDRAVYDSLL
jgi:CRP-like cAMP-binding protein